MMDGNAKCPVFHGENQHKSTGSSANHFWWPNQLNLRPLAANNPAGDPTGGADYVEAFKSIDYDALKKDLTDLMTDSQDWWPADYGHYGGLMIRMAWHSAGTYRTFDGRGGGATGTQRFAPLNSWPDNGNLDKARRLLWPIKQKYGNKISWADLMILAGNVAIESMGGRTMGFGGGRTDVWEPEEDIYWGPETIWLDDQRYSGDRELAQPLGAVQMGLIYVNPEGPNGNPDPMGSGRDIRETFARMAMNDEETVALVAGGHTFGKGHGAGAEELVGAEPEGAPMHEMGLGWINDFESGKGKHTTTSGFEGAWTPNPIKWDNGYFDVLFGYEWERVKSPAGHVIWHAVDLKDEDHAPEVDGSGEKVPLMMTTADMALRTDPIYEPIARRYHENPEEFAEAFARAWFKLTHRDMGPKILYHGPEVPEEDLIWQDPIPATTTTAGQGDLPALKAAAAECGTPVELVLAAWASASTYRDSDKRGGANGAHVALAPQSGWDVNAGVGDTIAKLDAARAGKGVSLADMIVIGGAAGVEAAAKAGGHEVTVPVSLGRGDATAEQTDADSFAVLEPQADGFRNYAKPGQFRSPEEILVDKAALMTLTAPELTVLVGGMRAMGANADGSDVGVMTDRKGALTPDFFANLLSMDTKWSPAEAAYMYEGADRATGALLWKASSVDLAIGSNSQLRAIAEVYAEAGAEAKFTADFVAAWAKVMDLDRFDLA